MEIRKCLLTKNDCYKAAKKITPKGIVVHSTGANNPNLKRYVQPDDGLLGKNQYNNDWNRSGLSLCVHGFIGKDKNGTVRVYQTLPFNYACWGVGSGTKGSYNYNPAYIQFEICEDDLTDKGYFEKAFDKAIEFCVFLCKEYNLSVDNVVSHKEAHNKGYGSNHSDCDHWLKKFGKDMNWFRAEVKARLATKTATTTTIRSKIKKGDLVSIKSGAKYYNGVKVPSWVVAQKWYVDSVSGDRAVISKSENGKSAINSPINVLYLTVAKASAKPTIKVGSKVKVKSGAKTYTGGKLANFVYSRTHKVKEINGNRVVITYLGITIAAVNIKDLTLV